MEVGTFRLDRNELAGAFGDMGTFFPLVTALVITNGVNLRGVLLAFGLLYIYSGVVFKMSIPVQPMKYVAATMIAFGLPASSATYSALAIGAIFLILGSTGAVTFLHKVIPRNVVRGIQLGLALNLSLLAFGFMQEDFLGGWLVSIVGIVVVLCLLRNTRIPPALALVAIGLGLAFSNVLSVNPLGNMTVSSSSQVSSSLPSGPMESLPRLIIPQIPLTIANAILATALLSRDLFPENKSVTVHRLTLSHGLMNIISGLLGGIPVCHGAGGLAGHHKFGARTGVAVTIIGSILISIGILYNETLMQFLFSFPLPILGVFLLFASLQLLNTVRKDIKQKKSDLFVAFFVAILSIGIRYGYVIGFAGGVALAYLLEARAKEHQRK